jgi:hypothetical protein
MEQLGCGRRTRIARLGVKDCHNAGETPRTQFMDDEVQESIPAWLGKSHAEFLTGIFIFHAGFEGFIVFFEGFLLGG